MKFGHGKAWDIARLIPSCMHDFSISLQPNFNILFAKNYINLNFNLNFNLKLNWHLKLDLDFNLNLNFSLALELQLKLK